MKVRINELTGKKAMFTVAKFKIGQSVSVSCKKGDSLTPTKMSGIVVNYSSGWNPPLVYLELPNGKYAWFEEKYLEDDNDTKEKVVFT